MQQPCVNLLGRGKAGHETRKKAERVAARAPRGVKLFVYHCPHCNLWHVSHQPPNNKPAPPPPSAKTLRRRLENAGREIRKTEREFAKLHARLARQEELEAAQQKQRELENDCIAQAIKELVDRLGR